MAKGKEKKAVVRMLIDVPRADHDLLEKKAEEDKRKVKPYIEKILHDHAHHPFKK